MKKGILGFTLSEVLVSVLVLGSIILIILPIIIKLVPNKSKIMFEKAYYTAENTISDMINDNGLYPYDTDNPGFVNTTVVTVDGVVYSVPTTKFCQAFASKSDLSGTADCTKTFNFTTNDGIVWALPTGTFSTGSSQLITVDVVGGTTDTSKNNPNCTYDASTCTNPDQFNLYVYNDGKLVVTGAKEMEYLDVNPPS